MVVKSFLRYPGIFYIIIYYFLDNNILRCIIIDNNTNKGDKMTRRKGKRQKRIDAFLENGGQQFLKDNVDLINEICNRVRNKEKSEKARQKKKRLY